MLDGAGEAALAHGSSGEGADGGVQGLLAGAAPAAAALVGHPLDAADLAEAAVNGRGHELSTVVTKSLYLGLCFCASSAESYSYW